MHRIAGGVPVTLASFQMFSLLILSWHCTEFRQPQGPRAFQSPVGLLPNALHLEEVAEVKQSCEYEPVCWKLQCALSSSGSLFQEVLVRVTAPALLGDPHGVSLGWSPCCCADTLPDTCSIFSPLMMVLNTSLGFLWCFSE